MPSTIRLSISDLREIRADLEAVEDGLGAAVDRAILQVAAPVLGRAERLAPYDSTHRGHRGSDEDPGHIRDSLHMRPTPYGAALYSTHPGAPVHEYGGTIAPKGTPFFIPPQAYALTAGESHADALERKATVEVDRLLRHHDL